MEWIIENSSWLILIALTSLFITFLYIYAELRLRKAKRKLKYETLKKINRQLLEAGMDLDEIREFWEEYVAEAQIQHNLPPCKCKDVNDCETWCRAKARFAMKPPED